MLASALVVGLAIGAAATIFGYSNVATVNVQWSVFHINGIPLWTVAVVPLAIVLLAGTLYHWMDGLHHFSEHMRHRRRVHELEAEVSSLRAHLDHVLEMPDHSTSRIPSRPVTAEPLPPAHETEAPALPEPSAAATDTDEPLPANGSRATAHRPTRTKRAVISLDADDGVPAPAPLATNGGRESAAAESTSSA
jgi:hypothetical protein